MTCSDGRVRGGEPSQGPIWFGLQAPDQMGLRVGERDPAKPAGAARTGNGDHPELRGDEVTPLRALFNDPRHLRQACERNPCMQVNDLAQDLPSKS